MLACSTLSCLNINFGPMFVLVLFRFVAAAKNIVFQFCFMKLQIISTMSDECYSFVLAFSPHSRYSNEDEIYIGKFQLKYFCQTFTLVYTIASQCNLTPGNIPTIPEMHISCPPNFLFVSYSRQICLAARQCPTLKSYQFATPPLSSQN